MSLITAEMEPHSNGLRDLSGLCHIIILDVALSLLCSGSMSCRSRGVQSALLRRQIEKEWKVELEETPDKAELNTTPVVPVVPSTSAS